MLKVLGSPFRFLYRIYFIIIFLFTALLFYPIMWFILSKPSAKRIGIAFKVKKIWARIFSTLILVFVKIEGKENIPKAPFIICTNHSSYLDIVLMYLIIPHTFLFMGKKELLNWPIIKIFFKNMDIPVDRFNRIEALKSIVKSKEAIDNGYSMVIFPEGGMHPNPPEMLTFKKGAFEIAIKKNVPILPITYTNNFKLYTHHEEYFGNGRPGIAKIKIHPAISSDKIELISLQQQTFDIINSAL